MQLSSSRGPGLFEHFDWVLFLLAASPAVAPALPRDPAPIDDTPIDPPPTEPNQDTP